jgi:translation initiation factor IF-3
VEGCVIASPHFSRRFDRREPVDRVRLNQRIVAKEIRVIGEDGSQLGIIPTSEALRLAQEQGVDLVEVAPTADPPVCRIMDYGKFKYQQQKKQQEAKKKQTVIQVKEIKVRPKTDEHDFQTKVRHIRRFIGEGDRCKVTVFFRGREIVHKDRGLAILQRVVEAMKDAAKVEQEPQAEGRTVFIVLAPLAKLKETRPEGEDSVAGAEEE